MHYEILANDPVKLVVKFNPAAYVSRLVCHTKPNPKAQIAFNANYFHGKAPIGLFEQDGWVRKKRLASKGERPWLKIGDCTIEAGPELSDDWRESMRLGQFQDDVARRTDHMAIGETWHGKIIVGQFKNSTLDEVSAYMKPLTVWSMNMDGGGSCYLKVGDLVRGKKLYVGVELEER